MITTAALAKAIDSIRVASKAASATAIVQDDDLADRYRDEGFNFYEHEGDGWDLDTYVEYYSL